MDNYQKSRSQLRGWNLNQMFPSSKSGKIEQNPEFYPSPLTVTVK